MKTTHTPDVGGSGGAPLAAVGAQNAVKKQYISVNEIKLKR
jgi:hypothetical protein